MTQTANSPGKKTRDNSLKGKKPFSSLIYRLSALIVRFIFFVNGGLRVEGTGNIPSEGGVIIAPNHISYLDPPLIGAVLPRRATFLAREGLFDIPILSWFIKHYALPVDREQPHPSTIKEVVKRLKNGEMVVIFPEGRRSETGELLEGKRGMGTIARLSKASVVPVLIAGSNKVLPFGARWLKRARVLIVFDSPVHSVSIYEKESLSSEKITQLTMKKIGGLKERYADNSR